MPLHPNMGRKPSPADEEIQNQLRRILDSPKFHATEITSYQEIRVLMNGSEGSGKRASDSAARFVLNGSVQKDMTAIKVAVNLLDTSTNMQIWGDLHHYDLEAFQLIPFRIDGFVKSSNIVMPDLIRHPELIEITGFRLGRHPGLRSGTE